MRELIENSLDPIQNFQNGYHVTIDIMHNAHNAHNAHNVHTIIMGLKLCHMHYAPQSR